MKVIISTGQGRLHLIESAKAIKKAGVEVNVITGWIPPAYLSDALLNFIGGLVGRTNLAYGLRKRSPKELTKEELSGNSIAEFILQLLFIFSKFYFIKKSQAALIGWKIFGLSTKKYLKNSDIFHVRSGAGFGAIGKAKKKGMVVLVDHSAAHPLEIYNQLLKIYKPNKIPVEPHKGLWKLVIDDCVAADYLLVNSDYVKKSFVKYGFKKERIFVIPLGIRKDFFSLKSNYEVRRKYKLLYTGVLNKWKGIDLLIETAELLYEKNIIFEFHLIGSISKELIIPNNLIEAGFIKLHGHVTQDKLKSFLKDSDIYVFPSYCEGSSQALKEAMSAGMPVIATEQSGAPIIDGVNGLIIEDGSSVAIFKALIKLMDDESLRKKIGLNAASTIKNGHTWDIYGKNVDLLYKKIIING
tara:strand:- start:4305 stop:5540 length:1236 start_codon:yes stop_codon:yes gene_type:complete